MPVKTSHVTRCIPTYSERAVTACDPLCRSGTLYVAHNSQKGEPGVVHKYSATGQHLGQALASDAITAQQGTGIAAMKLAGDSSKLLLTTGGSLVQQVDIETQKPVPGAAPHGGYNAAGGCTLFIGMRPSQGLTGMCHTARAIVQHPLHYYLASTTHCQDSMHSDFEQRQY